MSSDGPQYPQYPEQGDDGKSEEPSQPPPPGAPQPPPPPAGQSWQPSATTNAYGQSAAPGAPTNQKAMWSMILGIVGILGLCFVIGGLLLGIPATILGVLSRREINAASGGQKGGGMAIAGIILGIVGIILSLLLIAFWGYVVTTPEFQEGFQEGFEGTQ